MRWPLRSKYLRKDARISFEVIRLLYASATGTRRVSATETPRSRCLGVSVTPWLLLGASVALATAAEQGQDAIRLEALAGEVAVKALELAVVGNGGPAAQAFV